MNLDGLNLKFARVSSFASWKIGVNHTHVVSMIDHFVCMCIYIFIFMIYIYIVYCKYTVYLCIYIYIYHLYV